MFIMLFHPPGSDFWWKSGYLLWKLFARVDTIFPDRMMLIHLFADVSNCICWAILIWVWVKIPSNPPKWVPVHIPKRAELHSACVFEMQTTGYHDHVWWWTSWFACIIYIPIPPQLIHRIFQDWKSIVDIPIHTHLRHRIYYIYKYL